MCLYIVYIYSICVHPSRASSGLSPLPRADMTATSLYMHVYHDGSMWYAYEYTHARVL